jgi:hypothetical protein
MANITDLARAFFEACEAGQGWEVCQAYCHPDATFSAQAEPLADVKTLRDYTEWMKGLMRILPDGQYDLKAFATDGERQKVVAYGTGPIPGKEVLAHPRISRLAPITFTSWTLRAIKSDT